MSSHPKNVRVEILGEDSRGQSQQFIWQVLQKLGFNSKLFHKTSAPAGKGMGIKFVEDEFPKLLDDHRKLFIKSKSVRLIVCCDADKKTTVDRRQGLIQAVEQAGLRKWTHKRVLRSSSQNITSRFGYRIWKVTRPTRRTSTNIGRGRRGRSAKRSHVSLGT